MGHLFVVQADLSKLVVSDVIVPCDRARNFNRGFVDLMTADDVLPGTYKPDSHARPNHATEVRPGLWQVSSPSPTTRTWLLDSSADFADRADLNGGVDGLVDRITRGIEAIADSPVDPATDAADDSSAADPAPRRRLIGLTLMGINEGGFQDCYADVIRATLNRFEHLCARRDVDIVLALRNRADYAAVQHLRRREFPARDLDGSWDAARAEARRLAGLAADGHLVLFLGAGASVDAGLADWKGLLRQLARDVDLLIDDEGAFARLDPRDQALLIAAAPKAKELDAAEPKAKELDGARRRIAHAFTVERYPLTQALVASLRLDQAITTNYDVLYETAFNAGTTGGPSLQVLPREPYRAGVPWLMKIHGDAQVPATIVLSRDDYIRLDAESIPMASVLQSAMLTSHILFVGYSVSDENVVRLARQVVGFRERHNPAPADSHGTGEGSPSVGTVLVPDVIGVKSKLWQGVLGYVPIPSTTKTSWADRTRNVTIFLDLLGMYTCVDARYFLAGRYHDLLDDDDKPLKAALLDLQAAMPAPGAATPVSARVELLLRELGSETG